MFKLLKKFNNLAPPAKASIILMITTFVQKGIVFLSTPIFSRLLTPDELGQAAVFFSWYEVVAIFTTLCLEKGVFNNGMIEFKKDRSVFAFSMLTLSTISTVFFAIILIPFTKFIWNFFSLPTHLIIFMFCLLLVEEAYLLWTVRQRFEYKYKATAITTLILTLGGIISATLAILYIGENKVNSRIYGERLLYSVVFIVLFIVLAVKAKGKIKTSYWKFALKFNLPLIPHYLSLFILNHMDRIMIAQMVSNAAAGIYTVAYTAASVIRIFWTAINASLIPWTYEQCEKKAFKKINRITMMIISVYALICVMFMLFAPEIMFIMAKADYHEGINIIPPIMAGVFFSSLYYIFANVVYYYKKPKFVMIASGVAAVVNLALNLIFIPIFGYFSAAYTTLICYLIQTLIDIWAMKKVVKTNFYNMKIIAMLSVGVISFSLISLALYQNIIIRYAVIIIGMAIAIRFLIKNKENLKALISNFTKQKNKI